MADTSVSPLSSPASREMGMADRELPAYAAAIRRARAECGWSRGRLAYELERTIRREGMEPPARESLIRMIRAWENGEHKPDDCNRERLIKVLGNSLRDYIFPSGQQPLCRPFQPVNSRPLS